MGFPVCPEFGHIRKPFRSQPCADPLSQRHARNETDDIFDIPEVPVVSDPALLVEGETGDYMQPEMERRRDR